MKKLLSIVFLSFLSVAAFGQTAPTKTVKELQQQTKSFNNKHQYKVTYDKFEDRSTVLCRGYDLVGVMQGFAAAMAQGMGRGRGAPVTPSVFFGAAFQFPSETLTQPVKDYYLLFAYKGEGWEFLKTSKLIIIADGMRMQFGSGEADRNVNRSGTVSEDIEFLVSRAQLEKLAASKSVEIKIGNFVKTLKPEILEMFANVLKLGDTAQKVEDRKKK